MELILTSFRDLLVAVMRFRLILKRYLFFSQERFQALGAVYKLLSDKDRRAVYDETGDIDEGDDMDPDRDWDQYWRLLFKVTNY